VWRSCKAEADDAAQPVDLREAWKVGSDSMKRGRTIDGQLQQRKMEMVT